MEHDEINLIFKGGKIDDNLYNLLKSIYYIEYGTVFEKLLKMVNTELLQTVRIKSKGYHDTEELHLDE